MSSLAQRLYAVDVLMQFNNNILRILRCDRAT